MLALEGYQVEDTIYDSHKSLIIKGKHIHKGIPVVFKMLKNPFPEADAVARLEQEYQILSNLQLPGTVRTVALEKYGNSPVVVMEYFDGKPLADTIRNDPLDLTYFFPVALKIAEILGGIHENNIIHKDINLSNILRNDHTGEIKIIDFGIASPFSFESEEVLNPSGLEGTLFFISPEQTGRMNRTLDYRTDFYSLGVCFYKMVTGYLPFITSDPLGLIHCHIARTPASPLTLNPALPEMLDRIIMCLLAKRAEERYKSIPGLLCDLQQCYTAFRKGSGQRFVIGEKDKQGKFSIPENLYGREEELAWLAGLFAQQEGLGKQIVLLSGAAGIGKSSLLTEMHKFILDTDIHFVAGKYEEYGSNLPYSGLSRAFKTLCRQILSEATERLAFWKEQILRIAGSNGQVLVNLVPEIELIIGKQPVLEVLPPLEAQNRFTFLVIEFLKLFTHDGTGLVLCLDDLQWADPASFSLLLEIGSAADLKHMILVLSYRDNEIDALHPLSLMLGKVAGIAVACREIKLRPLSGEQVERLIADCLSCTPDRNRALAEVIYAKTGGNPFFIRYCLLNFYTQKFIRYDIKSGWEWDLESITQSGIMDNLADLMIKKIHTLSVDTQNIVKIASCFGSMLGQKTLALIYGRNEQGIQQALREAIDEGIMLKQGDNIKFSHDRIREAAYRLLAEKDALPLHYRIGIALWEQMGWEAPDETVYHITDQFNRARSLLSPVEREMLLEMNYQAGLKAKTANAYAAAAAFYRKGMELLPPDSWETQYARTLVLHTELAGMEYALGNFSRAEELFIVLLCKTHTLVDTIRIHSMIINCFNVQELFHDGIETGLGALQLLGIRIPRKTDPLLIVRDVMTVKFLLAGKKPADLLSYRDMKDERCILSMEILYKCLAASIVSRPELVFMLILKMIILSLKHGFVPATSYAFVSYGISVSAYQGDAEGGYAFGEIGKQLAEQSGVKLMKSGVFFGFTVCLMHLKRHFRDMLEEMQHIIQYCLAAGDFEHLGHTLSNYSITCLCSGLSLKQVYVQTRSLDHRVYALNQPHIINYHRTLLQTLAVLQGRNTAYINEEEVLRDYAHSDNQLGLGVFFLEKLFVAYLFCDYRQCLAYGAQVQKYISSFFGLHFIQFFVCYRCLSLLAAYGQAGVKEKRKYLREIRKSIGQFKQWGKLNINMYKHKYLLLKAEYYRIMRRGFEETIGLYQQALELAHNNSILFEEALINELAGKYLLEGKWKQAARVYLADAFYYYERWGAVPKLQQLTALYPDYNLGTNQGALAHTALSVASTSDISERLDLNTIVKAAHLISGEIKLDELLKRLMRFLIQTAGAEKGYFLLAQDNEWWIRASGHLDRDEVTVLQGERVASSAVLSPGLVNYVLHTREPVLLDDARVKNDFSNDEYILREKPLSLLCMPIVGGSKISAVLYLENNLVSGAFTRERCAVIQTLSSQIAISLENARMYAELDTLNKHLEKKVAERTRDLDDKNKKLTDSISYAKSIQNAFFPEAGQLQQLFPELFVLWQPREIVGGDFYWFKTIEPDAAIIGVVDCTGHGVPGAFMSIAAFSILDKIDDRSLLRNPAAILQKLNQEIKRVLKQNKEATDFYDSDDGLDASFCFLDLQAQTMLFAAARQSLFYIPGAKGSPVQTVLGDKQGIGYRSSHNEYAYNNHSFRLVGNEAVYLFTDGIIGQIGGERAFPMGRKRFMDIIEKIKHEPMENQKARIRQELRNYQGSFAQLDDITVLGLKIPG